MDIVGGLTAANLALGLVKDLRDIDRSVDEAAFKLKVSELTFALADTQIALSDANLKLNETTQQIQTLKNDLETATSGDICPKCRSGRMQLIRTNSHRMGSLGQFGVEDWHLACDEAECGFEQTKMHDPHGVIPKAAAKR